MLIVKNLLCNPFTPANKSLLKIDINSALDPIKPIFKL